MLVLDIIVSGFAAWGLFCAAKFLADGYMTPKNARPRPTVRLHGNESKKEIAELCENARKAIVCNRGEILLLLPDDDDAFAKEIEAMGLPEVKLVYEKREERLNE
jgi:hypothetical protein